MKNKVFDNYSRYYDLLYVDKNYESEVAYILQLLKLHKVDNGNILEFGSGTGKHGKLIAKNGYALTGVELSQEMVDVCEVSDNFSIIQGDITQIKLGVKFDIVLSLFHVMSYLVTNDNFNDALNNASLHLKSGGLFIFDFWYTPAVYSQKPEVRIKRMYNNETELLRIAEPTIHSDNNRVDVNFTIYAKNLVSDTIEVFSENHPMRHFSLPEIEFFARQNGFELIGSEEFLSGNSPSEDTWGVCVILKKISND